MLAGTVVDAVVAAWTTTWPVVAFLLLITLVSDLCADAKVFDVAAHLVARAGGGSTPVLFALYCALATVTTITLGIDTTAVMLTPVSLAVAAELELPPLPFAFATVWLANAASLLLPISNLTNLLAVERSGQHARAFAADLWMPQVVVLGVVLTVLVLRHRRAISGRYAVARGLPRHDRALVVGGGAVAGGITLATVAGVPAWVAAGAGLVALLVLCAVRAPRLVRSARLMRLVPTAILLGTFALFVLIELALEVLDPGPIAWPNDVAAAASGAGLANLVNNLPAWLALSHH